MLLPLSERRPAYSAIQPCEVSMHRHRQVAAVDDAFGEGVLQALRHVAATDWDVERAVVAEP